MAESSAQSASIRSWARSVPSESVAGNSGSGLLGHGNAKATPFDDDDPRRINVCATASLGTSNAMCTVNASPGAILVDRMLRLP